MKNENPTEPTAEPNPHPVPKGGYPVGTFWTCLVCDGRPQMEHEAFKDHLRTAHGLDPAKLLCKMQMLMHLDAAKTFTGKYAVTATHPETKQELQFEKVETCERDEESMMYWDGE